MRTEQCFRVDKKDGVFTFTEIDNFFEERVIFNGPATVLLAPGGKRTVVRCKEGEEFDPIVGYLIAKLVESGWSHGQVKRRLKEVMNVWMEMEI